MCRALLVVLPASLICVLACGCEGPSRLLLAPDLVKACNPSTTASPLVVANYNIKSGLWTSLEEVGDVLEGMDPDVLALEEVDLEMKRTDGVDQSQALADRLGMQRVFAGTVKRDGGTYGIALLSRLPFLSVKRFELPESGGFEPRTAIDAQLCAGPRPVRVVSTHADFLPWAVGPHAKAIADAIEGDPDVLVLGDMNVTPESDAMQPLLARPMQDALAMFDDEPTFGDNDRLDYILTDNTVDDAKVIDADASDHRPVLATVTVDAQ